MPFRKISETVEFHVCRDPQHEPPGAVVLSPGTYKWTCPACGRERVVIVPLKPSLSAQEPPTPPHKAPKNYEIHRPDLGDLTRG